MVSSWTMAVGLKERIQERFPITPHGMYGQSLTAASTLASTLAGHVNSMSLSLGHLLIVLGRWCLREWQCSSVHRRSIAEWNLRNILVSGHLPQYATQYLYCMWRANISRIRIMIVMGGKEFNQFARKCHRLHLQVEELHIRRGHRNILS